MLYVALASGCSLDEAMVQARLAMANAEEAYIVDWGIPVLYATQTQLQWPKAAAPLPLSQTAAEATLQIVTPRGEAEAGLQPEEGRRTRAQRAKRSVILADLDAQIGYLDELVERLNRIQSFFDFRSCLFAYPSGSVRRVKGLPRFVADSLTVQVRRALRQFGGDYLAAFTRHSVYCERVWDLFSAGDDTYAVISTKGVRGFAERAGRPFEYAVAFLLAGQLLGALTELDYHKKTRACLMDYCDRRSDIVKSLKTGRLQACCRAKVGDRHLLKAIDQILAESYENLRVSRPSASSG
jgi:hypothetical protein